MRVYAVIKTYFNGDGDSESVAGVFSSYEAADAAAKDANVRELIKTQGSSYASTYAAESDGFEIDGEIKI